MSSSSTCGRLSASLTITCRAPCRCRGLCRLWLQKRAAIRHLQVLLCHRHLTSRHQHCPPHWRAIWLHWRRVRRCWSIATGVGLDSVLVVAALEQRGCTSELLPGGWPSYRRWGHRIDRGCWPAS